MALAAGTRLGPYEIVALIGAGGMGEVYRARDTKLDRHVAIKVLPAALADDPERLARLEREAKVLAALNHPNIATIYGVEDRALVMELVEGQDLAGPLPLETALDYARQIADALESAHEKGVVHRDLKPANVKVTPQGMVKVLDFGLAAVLQESAAADAKATNSPTLTLAATQLGVLLGTAGYMSPEQAAGRPVDKRADIWSFGVVLWEMLTGNRLFAGETISHTLADVLRAPIDFDKLPAPTPSVIRGLLERCLDRELKTRLRDIGEARIQIQKWQANPMSPPASATAPAKPHSGVLPWAVAAAALIGLAGLGWVHLRERTPAADVVRLQILPPEKTEFRNTVVLSPDGRKAVFDATGPNGRPMLWIRSLDSLEARPLAGTESSVTRPFWSPDSRFIGFAVSGFPGKLKTVEVAGGAPQTLCDLPGSWFGGSWDSQGAILFGAAPGGISRVSERGGAAAPVTVVDPSRGELLHSGPAFLPDGKHFLYFRRSSTAENGGIYVGSLDIKPEQQNGKRLLSSDSDPIYVPTLQTSVGHILFMREGSLVAQPFDTRQMEFTGATVSLAEGIGNTLTYGWFSASVTGALAYRSGRYCELTAILV